MQGVMKDMWADDQEACLDLVGERAPGVKRGQSTLREKYLLKLIFVN